jgi:hypothetical protein
LFEDLLCATAARLPPSAKGPKTLAKRDVDAIASSTFESAAGFAGIAVRSVHPDPPDHPLS